MAFVYWSQLKSMLIKDQLIRKRHWISSLFEFLLPILLVLLHVWFLDDQGTTHLSTSDAPKSNVVKQNSPPLKYSSDVYFSQTFYCNSFGSHIYYTSPNDAASKLLPPKFAACSLRTVSLANDSAVIKAWGDAVDERFRNANSAVFFHELDVDKGIANYTIGGLAIEYGGPYSEPVLNTYQDYIRTQSVVNILMANYPDLASLKESNLEYVYTSKLFNEGNPSDGKEMDPDTKPASQSTFQIDIFNYLEAYAFLEIGLIYLSSIITRRLIREKVTNSKELLRIMGLSDLVYWISHFINYLSLSIFHATFITIIYSVFRTRNPYGNWNASLFWFNYLITSISNILFSFTFTTVLNRPIIGVLLVIVGRAGLAYAPIAASTSTVKLLYISPKVWSCLLPCGQLHFSIYDMFYFGASVKGLSWSNIFQSIESPETLLLGYIYLTALVSWFVYSLLIWYLDAVWPWQSGTPKPWHFPVSSFFNKPIGDIEMNGSTTPDSNDLNGNTNIRYEPEPPLLKPSVKCINLYKSFGSTGGKKFAVNGLNLNILKGQITVLLGHNGAGKTTTMSMITGMLKPSAGKVLVNGIDLHQDTVAARRCLALCPQTDLLFEELTVTENLELVTGLRGLSREVKKQLIPLNIERVNLTDKTDTLACNLSGGMRRRLQLALALSTASETLILDEPTSGLDPESRRQLWNLLLELRKDLSILLTTHFMEEADALGDRIVIMSSGEIKCSGSPMFLKHRFGTGNSIRIAKNVSTFNQDSLLDTMKAHFPNAVATNETNEEIVYQLSSGIKSTADISTATLAQLCDSLDENLNSLGITSYGISVTTLEDVFLKVSEDDGESEQTRVQMEDKLFELNKILCYQRLNGLPLFLQRMKGLLMKRVNYTKRHYKTIGFTIILPVIVLLFTFLTAKSTTYSFMPSQELDYPYPIELNLKSIYGPNAKAVIRATFKKNVPFIKAYNEIMEKAGVEVINIPVSLSLNEYMKTSNQSAGEFMRDNIFGLIEDSSKLSGFALWFNPRVALSLPLTIDAWTNTLIRLNGNEMSRVTTTIMAMPNRGTNEPFVASSISQIVSAIFAPIAFALISCSYFLFPSIEAQNKANLIQRMSGIKAPIFWFSHLVFDFSYHIIVSIIILITITVVDQFIFTSVKAFGSIFLLLLLHGLSSIPLFYIFSLLPMNTDRGFSLLTTISLVCTLVGSALAASLVSFGKIKSVHVVLGDLFPPFAMSFGLSKVYGAAKLHSECARINACDPGNTVSRRLCCNEDVELISFNPFKWTKDGILVEILMLTLDWIIYTAILIVLDVNLHRLIYWYDTVKKKLSEASETQGVVEDEDVIAEKHRVQQLIQSQKIDSEALVVNELSKDFGSFRAVDKVNFAVHKAECFGLLGINGAGKTTTFRMLTGDATVTQGDAFIESYSLRNDLQNFQQSISYCPQFDALIDNLTPQETLTLFARIRGMPESKVKDNVNYIITSTDLTNFAKTCNQNLSGGNKRKLSLAIASIARPKVMFLDEPTTGVDPSSRRKIWSTLMHLRDTSGSSIVLTSHSMDECEALCSRIGIMARGNFKCLGSTQHLKEKFGQGFTLIVKINQEALKKEDEIDRIKQFIKDEFPSSILRDFHQTILHYHITDTSSRWGDMLRSLDHGKGALMIEDFTLSGTTLEQIFLSFAKES